MTVTALPVGFMQANCYIVSDGSCGVIIDPGDEATRILRAAGGLVIGAVLLTHAHYDHIGAAYDVFRKTAAPLYVHESDLTALNDPALNLSGAHGIELPRIENARILREGDTVCAGELVFHTVHTPGHTPGSCSFLCGDNLFSGDTLFAGNFGRTDFPGGSGEAMASSLARLLSLPEETAVFPGHGESTSVGREKRGMFRYV